MVFDRSKHLALVKSCSLLWLTLFVLLLPSSVFSASIADYQLGAGDKIKIQVFGEEDLTVESLIGEAGTISYPFLGELKVRGITVGELEREITKKLKGPYLIDPEVTVSILEYRQFYVNGYVEKPGGFPFQPGMTVRKAISLAGGFKERANKDKIFVVRGDDLSGAQRPVQLDQMVKPDDIVTVERSFF